VSIGGLQRSLKEQLPDYMVPTAWVFLDELPLTPNGKVDRLALPAPSAPDRRHLAVAYEEPQTQMEATLAVMWQEVLRAEKVGIYDDFFDLGGHSLLAIQIMNRIKETFQIDLPMRAIFDDPTIAGLSSFVEETLIERLEATSGRA
jgi:acyl carrier protein